MRSVYRVILGQIHGYLACLYHFAFPRPGMNGGSVQREMLAYHVDDVIHRNGLVLVSYHLPHNALRQFHVNFLVVDGGVCTLSLTFSAM